MNRRIGWLGVVLWTALTLAGALLAVFFHFPGGYGESNWNRVVVGLGAGEGGLGAGVAGFVFGALSGLVIAGLQALLLRAWGGPDRAWVVFNMAGYGLVHALADGVPYRPFTIIGGGIIVALCQYLALRPVLTKPGWWLPVAAGAWWLGFGLTAEAQAYNYTVVGLLLGAATGLALRLLIIPTDRPAQTARGPG